MNTRLDSAEIDKIACACIDAYNKLPKTGKPVAQEWTVLSSIVKCSHKTGNIEVITLGTGSKCIGATKMSPKGDTLNDSHAEVMARRGFLVYLYENMKNVFHNRDSIFEIMHGKFILKEGISFVFYSSQLPCGDASILPKNDIEMIGDILVGLKRKIGDECDIVTEVAKTEPNDIHRTGAKCLPSCLQDLKGVGKDYHVLGQVRTKPGRGDKTLSVSCSDKIAKWIHVGVQGALLDLLLKKPIYIANFIFGAGMPYSMESVKRAFLYRCTKNNVMDMKRLELNVTTPQFYQSNVKFPHIKNENLRPAPGSIIWINTQNQILEVAVLGRKLGSTKKKNNVLSAVCISKFNLLKRFFTIVNQDLNIKKTIFNEEDVEKVPYNNLKALCGGYVTRWIKIKTDLFTTWTVKPDIWNFSVGD